MTSANPCVVWWGGQCIFSKLRYWLYCRRGRRPTLKWYLVGTYTWNSTNVIYYFSVTEITFMWDSKNVYLCGSIKTFIYAGLLETFTWDFKTLSWRVVTFMWEGRNVYMEELRLWSGRLDTCMWDTRKVYVRESERLCEIAEMSMWFLCLYGNVVKMKMWILIGTDKYYNKWK